SADPNDISLFRLLNSINNKTRIRGVRLLQEYTLQAGFSSDSIVVQKFIFPYFLHCILQRDEYLKTQDLANDALNCLVTLLRTWDDFKLAYQAFKRIAVGYHQQQRYKADGDQARFDRKVYFMLCRALSRVAIAFSSCRPS